MELQEGREEQRQQGKGPTPSTGQVYLLGLEVELRDLLVLPVREQMSSCLQSSKSVQEREKADGWGNDPVCGLRPFPFPYIQSALRKGMGIWSPFTSNANVFLETKKLLRLQ